MHEPLSGSQFLVIYGTALALTLVWPPHCPLDVYRLAYLAGGHQASAALTASAPVRSIGNELRQRGLVAVASARFATGVGLGFVVGLVSSVNGSALHRPTAGLNVLRAQSGALLVGAASLGGFAPYPDHATSLALKSGVETLSGGGGGCGG
ncbi:hypothetical protein [Amycolatopsis sp. GA6-003]|uniref:hypothetical protein n=1 Tax=Amycolatopsis sp. GA6-003 TaxID=2652444 RepID=UPI0039174E44